MWILVFFISLAVGGQETAVKLEQFPTKQECYNTLFIVQRDMASAYSSEPLTYRLSCIFKEMT